MRISLLGGLPNSLIGIIAEAGRTVAIPVETKTVQAMPAEAMTTDAITIQNCDRDVAIAVHRSVDVHR